MDDLGGAPWALGGGLLVWMVQALWTKLFSTEGKANDRLVDQLSQRVGDQERRLQSLDAGLDEERRLRREAESKVFQLQLYIVRLEYELKKHGITVPPPQHGIEIPTAPQLPVEPAL